MSLSVSCLSVCLSVSTCLYIWSLLCFGPLDSMGGGISSLFAGTYPELVERLVLIEGFGPVSKDPSTAASSLRKALDAETKFHSKEISISGGRLYANVHEAVSDN